MNTILGASMVLTGLYGAQHILRFRGVTHQLTIKEKDTDKEFVSNLKKTIIPFVWLIQVLTSEEDGYQWYAMSFRFSQKKAREKAREAVAEFITDKLEKNEL